MDNDKTKLDELTGRKGPTANPFDPDFDHDNDSKPGPMAHRENSATANPRTVPRPEGVPVNLPDPDYYKTVKGWGVDIDPDNDPTYSIKPNRTGDEQLGYTWKRPPQQEKTVEILRSIERPTISSVYGSSTPPAGISGMLRRYAFQHSESTLAHWLPLVAADRINVFEGYIEDLSRGHFPNVFAERGWKAEWKHDPQRVMRKVAIGAAITAGIVALACRKHNKR